MCGCLSGVAELCRLLSSCLARGRLLLCLLLGFASVPLPAAPSVFRGVSCRRLPFGGYATFLAPVACPAPAVELCLLGLQCLSGVASFLPCVHYSSGFCGWRCVPCRRLPLGVSALFLTPSACPTAALVAYVGQQPFSSVIGAYPAPAGLLGFAGYTPCVRELP